jgi:hypothetical protein
MEPKITKNIDDILLSQPAYNDVPEKNEIIKDIIPAEQPLNDADNEEKYVEPVNEYLIKDEPSNDNEQEHSGRVEKTTTDTEVDDYGNQVSKKEKVYTQSEVENMMRDRLSRVKQEQQQAPQPQYQQQPSHQTNQDLENDNWEAQLESFIEGTLTKREQKAQQNQWQQQEQEKQQQFELKFNQSAMRYNDFESIVMGKPITPQMLIATRGMQDPAAFIYTAAKTQEKELSRIAAIQDPYAQTLELGRLEERMKRTVKQTSSAPKPAAKLTGDVVDNKPARNNIDDKLVADEKQKLRNLRR